MRSLVSFAVACPLVACVTTGSPPGTPASVQPRGPEPARAVEPPAVPSGPKRSAESAAATEDDARVTDTAPVARAAGARERKWNALVEQCRDLTDWSASQSAHYFFVSPIRDEAYLAELRERAEAIRAEIRTLFPHPTLDPIDPDRAPTVVRVMKDQEQYQSYGGPGGSAGYFSARDGEIVIYDGRRSGGRRRETLANLQGLAYRAYRAELHGERDVGAWFDEGFTAYFATFEPVDGGLAPRRESSLRPLYERAVEEGTLPHVQDLLVADRRKMFEQDELRAEAWALVWFLLRGQARDANGRGRWDAFLPTYYEIWSTGGSLSHARVTASRGIDWGALERAMRDAVLGAQPTSTR